jgi:hypothetical protein
LAFTASSSDSPDARIGDMVKISLYAPPGQDPDTTPAVTVTGAVLIGSQYATTQQVLKSSASIVDTLQTLPLQRFSAAFVLYLYPLGQVSVWALHFGFSKHPVVNHAVFEFFVKGTEFVADPE